MNQVNGSFDPNAPVSSGDVTDIIRQMQQGHYPWWYPRKAMGLAIGNFTYTANFLPLLANSSQPQTVNIDGDSAFFITKLMAVETSVDNLTVVPVPPVLIELKSAGSGAYLSSGPVMLSNWFGTAQRPGIFDQPYILSPNSAFVVQAQNLEATDRNLRIAFQGIKIFSYVPTDVDGRVQL